MGIYLAQKPPTRTVLTAIHFAQGMNNPWLVRTKRREEESIKVFKYIILQQIFHFHLTTNQTLYTSSNLIQLHYSQAKPVMVFHRQGASTLTSPKLPSPWS